MDEEDLMMMNEDRKLENTDTFRDQFAGERQPAESSSMATALESLIAPAKTSIGQTLLQKLGWRPGQGIGPRVSLRKLRIQETKLGTRPAGSRDDEDDDMSGGTRQHTFAPRDNKLVVYAAKEDKHGLGYQPGRGMGRLPQRRDSEPEHARSYLTTVFGTDFAEDGEDDPYGAAASTERAFAFDNGDEDEVVVMGESSKPGPSATSTSGGDKNRWHDGRPVLSGFERDPLSVPTDKW